jgi:endoglucanase
VTTTPTAFEFAFTPTFNDIHGQFSFQMGGQAQPFDICVDNISMIGGVYPPGGAPRDFGSPVRVNQHGYVANGPKRATVVTAATTPQPWQLLDAAGVVAAQGNTTVYGDDAMSGDRVHTVDFSNVRTVGTGYTLVVGSDTSLPFDIGKDVYATLRHDALAYFYHNRSGIPIEAQYVGDAYARAAGHIGVAPNQGDISVPCLPGTCNYSLDVRGGWYDAGDHGKYVVNGGIAAWQMLDQYERSLMQRDRTGTADGVERIPEAGNGVPDVLDEARWEIEFLLRMQVPSGQPLAGMVHHKVHDLAWTAHPMAPANDPQPRYLHPPSTAATLNLAAVGARCAKDFIRYDRDFASRCAVAADKAWRAALANPDRYAPPGGEGGGAYADTDVSDEFSWAAAELYAITGRAEYKRYITTTISPEGFYWGGTGGLADLTLVNSPHLSGKERAAVKARIVKVADGFLADMRSQGYANPYLPTDGKYVWGSNSSTTNNMMIIAMAGDLTGERRYRDAVLEGMDYLLGRNALNQSYISGYGERSSHNQHHRFWAHQINAAYPNPAAGSIAGGPNSGLEDPVAQQNLPGCAPAKCYIDDLGSWSTNEVAINWNSSLAWVAAYADAVG